MRIAVIDGQGGGIGSLVVKRLREEFGDNVEIIALGTNSAATTSMMKARANSGATGENAIVWNKDKMDIIVGTLSIVLPNGMLGELTPAMAEAVSSSSAIKILIPINQEGVRIVGLQREPLPHLIEKVIEEIKVIARSVQ
jgi:NAD(P)-dependent dehydrogenase (short-subunit alcohol dehydrogenase family)